MGFLTYSVLAILVGIVLIIIAQAFVPQKAVVLQPDESLLTRLDLLAFDQFAELMTTLVSRMGLEVDFYERGNDGRESVRILAERTDELSGGRYAIVVLRGAGEPVSVDQVHKLRQWARYENAMKGILIAPAEFTRDAENVVSAMPGVPVQLVDGLRFEEWLSEYTPQEIADLPLPLTERRTREE